MSPHEQLVAARNLIDRTGWTCGAPKFPDRGPGLCVEEALGIVLGYPDWSKQNSWIHDTEAYGALAAACGLKVTDWNRHFGVWCWNDGVCQTKEQALAAYDRAIASTAPEPDLASLNLNVNGGRKDWNALEGVHAALRDRVAR